MGCKADTFNRSDPSMLGLNSVKFTHGSMMSFSSIMMHLTREMRPLAFSMCLSSSQSITIPPNSSG